jgi:hypothetical protein
LNAYGVVWSMRKSISMSIRMFLIWNSIFIFTIQSDPNVYPLVCVWRNVSKGHALITCTFWRVFCSWCHGLKRCVEPLGNCSCIALLLHFLVDICASWNRGIRNKNPLS